MVSVECVHGALKITLHANDVCSISKHADISKDGEIEVKRNPTYDIRLNPMVVSEDLPTYQEIPAVATKPTIVEDVL